MSKRATLVLAIVNAALLAFIVFVDAGSLSTSELAGRRGHVLTRFVRDRVERVELTRGDEPPIVFEREALADDAEEGTTPTWRMRAPVDAAVDDDALEGLLGDLEWLDARRTLQGISDADRGRFGLDAPRFTVGFTVGDETVALRVGGEAPTGEGVYVAVDGEDRAYVVGEDFVEAIDHDADHFRSKALFAGFYPNDAISMRLDGGEATVLFEREDDRWRVREPVRGLASRSVVDALGRAVRDLSATRFIAEDVDELEERGLDAPWRELVITRPEDEDGARTARLRVGATCGEHAEERYVIAGDDGPIACARESALAALTIDPARLREARLVTMSDDAVERVELEGEGATLTLRRGEEGWQLEVGEETGPADEAAVTSWLAELEASRALDFEALDGAPGHGLASPRRTLTLRRSDEESRESVTFGDAGEDGVWARRGDEDALVRFPAAVDALVSASALRFRPRDVVDGVEASDARLVEVRRGASVERAVRGEGGAWMLEAPIVADADRVVTQDIARHVATLRAARIVAERPAAEHALGDDARAVSVRYEPEDGEARTVTVRIGAETVDGAYARVGDVGPVIEIGRDVAEALARPLISLDLMTVDAQHVERVRIQRGGEVHEIARAGADWRTPSGAAPDAERTRQLLDRLSTLRASSLVRYGAPSTEPEVTVSVTRREAAGEPRVIRFGIGPDEEDGVSVAREDPAVVLRLRPEHVAIFRTYAP